MRVPLVSAVNTLSSVAASHAAASSERAATINQIDTDMSQARTQAYAKLAESDPQAVLSQINDAASAAEQSKSRRTYAKAGAVLATVAIGASAGLYAFNKTTGYVGDAINGIESILKPAVPHKVTYLEAESALKGVTLPDELHFGRGIIETTSKLDINLESCTFLGCVTLTGEHNNSTVLSAVDGVAKAGAITLRTGSKPNATRAEDYYIIADVDPTALGLSNGDPSAEALQAAGLAPNAQLVKHGGKDGRLSDLFSGISSAILGSDNNYASRADITDEFARKASVANCGPLLNETIAPGLAEGVTTDVENAIRLNESLPSQAHGHDAAQLLRAMVKQPIHINYVKPVDPEARRAGVQASAINPANVHLYNGRPVDNVSSSTESNLGTKKISISLSAKTDGCKLTEKAHQDLEAIAQQGGYVYEPVIVAKAAGKAN